MTVHSVGEAERGRNSQTLLVGMLTGNWAKSNKTPRACTFDPAVPLLEVYLKVHSQQCENTYAQGCPLQHRLSLQNFGENVSACP